MRRRNIKFGIIAGFFVFIIYYLCINTAFHYGNRDRNLIIFLETSNATILTSRTACSIESASYHHPHSEVVFYSIQPISLQDDYRNALGNVSNIQFRLLNVAEVFDGTPLFPFYTSGVMDNSSYPAYHLSDAVRLAILWKKSGIYLDNDMIVTRPFDNFTNSLSYVFPGVGNNVLIFEQSHPFLFECMLEYAANFRGDVYNHQGPELVTRVLKRVCGVDYLRPMISNPESCQGVTLQPYKTFFTHIWIDWRKAFLRPQEDYSKSYAMHLNSKLSNNITGVPGDGSLLDLMAMEFCPLTYQLMVANNVL